MSSSLMRDPRRLRPGKWLVLAASVLALAIVVSVGAAAATRFHHRASASSCSSPTLAGSVVNVTLTDNRSMMGGGSMMNGGGSMLGQNDWPRFRHGMMTVTAAPPATTGRTVSLLVSNTGYLTHELVMLPLAAGQLAGQRAVGADGKVSETGSVGEASATCAAGAGDGITAGSAGWITLHLPAGRYELVCNLAGHYTGGMYTELDLS
jgi:uncharacterized cupredoxin-like copper-binding protein